VKAGLGAVYFLEGANVALDPRLDPWRRYSRYGQDGNGYSYFSALGRWIDARVGIAVAVKRDLSGELLAVLQIYNVTFWVPLAQTVTLPGMFGEVPGFKWHNHREEQGLIGHPTVLLTSVDCGVVTARLHCRSTPWSPLDPEPSGEILQTFNSLSPAWCAQGSTDKVLLPALERNRASNRRVRRAGAARVHSNSCN
jgi:hypothetical protein